MAIVAFQRKGKLIIGIFFLLLVLGVIVLIGPKAVNFFAKADVCSAQNIEAKQISSNSAVITWDTGDDSQGRVEYGTVATELTFTAPEAEASKTHNVPLTLLTPSTVYYYLIAIGNTRCDSSGQKCDENCAPWSFTTDELTPSEEVEEPSPTPTITAPFTSPTIKSGLSPTHALSSFCNQVQLNIGSSNRDATKWGTVKDYDIDNNGVINGIDVIKCQRAGK